MNTIDWFVIVAGAATIAWVNWYFFVAERSTATAAAAQDNATQTAASDTTAEVTGAAR